MMIYTAPGKKERAKIIERLSMEAGYWEADQRNPLTPGELIVRLCRTKQLYRAYANGVMITVTGRVTRK